MTAIGSHRQPGDGPAYADGRFFVTTAMIFGLGGTIVNVSDIVEQSWREAAGAVGVSLDLSNGFPHEMGPREAVRLLTPQLSEPIREEIVRHVLAAQVHARGPMTRIPGTNRLLGSIPVDRWAVVTSAGQLFADKVMRAARVPTPLGLVTGDDVEQGKPHPEPFLRGARSLRIPEPRMCVAVEGSPAGVRSAKQAGMRVVAVATTFPAVRLASADWIVGDPRWIRVNKIPDGLYVELARPPDSTSEADF